MKRAIEINLPIQEVVDLFMDKSRLQDWKTSVLSYEHLSGSPGEVGATAKLEYKLGTIFETIISKNLPHEIILACEHGKTKVEHTVSYRFYPITENSTRFEMEVRITRYSGLASRIILALLYGESRKYYQGQLNHFKAFAEKETII